MEPASVSGLVTVEDQRSYIKIETLRCKNPSEIHRALSEVCGKSTVDRSTVSRWANRFRGGRVSIINDPRPGRPKTSTDERCVKLVIDALEEDRRATCEELFEITGITPTSVSRILTNDLNKRKISSRWVPYSLTVEQKKERMDIATLLKQIFDIENDEFLHRIVVIDEIWIRGGQSKIKQIIILAYDHQGIIITDRVPFDIKKVTSIYYSDFMQKLRKKMQKTRLNLLEIGPLILHDNVRPNVENVVTIKLREFGWEVLPHAPNSPDMIPTDFDLYPKLKQYMRGRCLTSLEEFSVAITEVFQQLNISCVFDGIVKLPRRWDSIIEKQGDYIEGL